MIPEPVQAMMAATSEGICGVCFGSLRECGWCACCGLTFTAGGGGMWITMWCECETRPWSVAHSWGSRNPCDHRMPWVEEMEKLLPDFRWSSETCFGADGTWAAFVYLRDERGRFYNVDGDVAREWRMGLFEEVSA